MSAENIELDLTCARCGLPKSQHKDWPEPGYKVKVFAACPPTTQYPPNQRVLSFCLDSTRLELAD